MARIHQQPTRDSSELCDGQKAIPAGHIEKIFETLLNHFGSGVQGQQARMRFEKRRQRKDETIDKLLDDLEMLRMRSQPNDQTAG